MVSMIYHSYNIEKLNYTNVDNLVRFFDRNDFESEYFYPHPFTKEFLLGLLSYNNLDFYCMMLLENKVISYGLLRGWNEGYIIPSLGVAVDKNYRGLGIGNLMCEYLHVIAKIDGCKQIILRVNKDNNIAKSLYEKLGYVFTNDKDSNYLKGYKIL